MDQRKKQLLIWIWMIAIAVAGGFLVFKAIRLYTPWDFGANVNHLDAAQPDKVEVTQPSKDNKDAWASNLSWGSSDWIIKNDEVDFSLMPSWNITLIVPAWVDNNEFKQVRLQIEAKYNVKTTVHGINTITEYQTILRAYLQHPEKADIVLVPTNWIDSFTTRWYHIPFKTSIAPLFHPLFRSWVDHPEFTYLPYAIDPYVTFYNPASYTPKGKTTFSNIQSALLTPRKTTTGYLPLLFGIDAGDLAVLEQWGVPYPGYIELLQLFLQMDISIQKISLLDFFSQTSYRDTARFHALTTTLGEHVNSCQYLPQLCLLAYDISDVGFWRLHEIGYLKSAFPNARAQIEFSNIPTLGSSYPVTGRGWIISKDSQNLPASLTWMKWYLEILVDEEPFLYDDVLSATNAVHQRQIIEDRYLPLAQFSNQYKLVVWSITDSQKLLQKTALIPMLRGEYSKWIFMKSMIDASEQTSK